MSDTTYELLKRSLLPAYSKVAWSHKIHEKQSDIISESVIADVQ